MPFWGFDLPVRHQDEVCYCWLWPIWIRRTNIMDARLSWNGLFGSVCCQGRKTCFQCAFWATCHFGASIGLFVTKMRSGTVGYGRYGSAGPILCMIDRVGMACSDLCVAKGERRVFSMHSERRCHFGASISLFVTKMRSVTVGYGRYGSAGPILCMIDQVGMACSDLWVPHEGSSRYTHPFLWCVWAPRARRAPPSISKCTENSLACSNMVHYLLFIAIYIWMIWNILTFFIHVCIYPIPRAPPMRFFRRLAVSSQTPSQQDSFLSSIIIKFQKRIRNKKGTSKINPKQVLRHRSQVDRED
jgi:hypothetical protein